MPKLIVAAKSFAENLPASAGRSLSWLPFSLRLGLGYRKSRLEISRSDVLSDEARENDAFKRLRRLVTFAYEKIPFYRELYAKNGFHPSSLQTIEDWHRVPIVTKADLQKIPLSQRSTPARGSMLVNTGGTSGQPLEFCLDSNAFAREWAHMHFIWKARGYRQTHLKLTFRGKHFDRAQPLRYNAVHNEYIVNANCPMAEIVPAVLALPGNDMVRWLHGYPSLVAEFAHELSRREAKEVAAFRSRLFGVLLGSEYPAPTYRAAIAENLSGNIVSWYGHSEMSVLARETSLGLYESLPTYGFAEAVPTESVNGHRLVCTSFDNTTHPFIRYDTGDLIEPISSTGGSLAFRVSEGRVGDFVADKNGNRHSLTAIIFGRHHAAFERLQHLQVRDDGGGQIVLLVTPRNSHDQPEDLIGGFDLDDLDFDLRLEVVSEPIRTKAGKIRLKID